MISCLLAHLLLHPALAASPDPRVAEWESRTGGALVLDETTRLEPGLGGSLVVAGPGTSLFLLLDSSEGAARKALDAQIAPFTQAGIRAPTVAEVACTVAGTAATCLTATLEVAPGAAMRLLAGQSLEDGFTAVCLDRKGAWAAPCQGVISARP